LLIVNEKHFNNGLFLMNGTKMGAIFDSTKNLIFIIPSHKKDGVKGRVGREYQTLPF